MSKLDLIEIAKTSEAWQDGVTRGVNLLVQQQIATPDLAKAIIKSTEELGPYYVVMPKVALAHTQVGPYNLKSGLSLVIYPEPIKFSDKPNHLVNLLFVLSATDGQSHMSQLANFASVMGQDGIVDRILNCSNKQAVYEIIKEFL